MTTPALYATTIFIIPRPTGGVPYLIGHAAGMYEWVRLQRAAWWRIIHGQGFDTLPTEDAPHVLDPAAETWH